MKSSTFTSIKFVYIRLDKLTIYLSLPLLVKQKSEDKINLNLNLNFEKCKFAPYLIRKLLCLPKSM